VHARHLPQNVHYAAVFDALVEGTYDVRVRRAPGNPASGSVIVRGGQVARHDLAPSCTVSGQMKG
jgi:hypothetical protein